MSQIKQDPKNYRSHSDQNKQLIRKSLEKLGAGRSIVLDGEGYIVAGNGVHEQAEALGIPVRIIETDGSELVAIKRTDLKLNDPRRKELALADNATSDSSDWNLDNLSEWDAIDLEGWGIEDAAWGNANGFSMDELTGEESKLSPSIKITFPNVQSLECFEPYVREKLKTISPEAYYSVSAGEL